MKAAHQRLALFVLLACTALAACTSLDDGKEQGSEGGPCFENHTCNEGLSCRSDLCVDRGSPAKDRDSSVDENGGGDASMPSDDGKGGTGGKPGTDAGSVGGTAGGPPVAGTGGPAGTGGRGGTGGSGGSTPDDGDGGVSGSGGTGTGGTSGSGGVGGTAGKGGTGGSGGNAGAGGAGGGLAGSGALNLCVGNVMASDAATTAQCATCLCNSCTAELTAMTNDSKAQALLVCGRTNDCSENCCFCNDTTCTSDNYRSGACAAETEAAAGVPTPSTFATHGLDLLTRCMTANNSCNKATKLAACTKTYCSTQCPAVESCN